MLVLGAFSGRDWAAPICGLDEAGFEVKSLLSRGSFFVGSFFEIFTLVVLLTTFRRFTEPSFASVSEPVFLFLAVEEVVDSALICAWSFFQFDDNSGAIIASRAELSQGLTVHFRTLVDYRVSL